MESPVDLTVIVTWPQAAVAVVLILALLVWPTVGSWLTARATRVQIGSMAGTVDEVREHVANTHSTNLREDLDGMADDIREARALLEHNVLPRLTTLETAAEKRGGRRMWRR